MESKKLPASIYIFGFVSLLTDISSHMIYPLLPVFLTQYLGAGQGFLGLIEGFSDSAAAFFMLFSGIWADRIRDRSRLVLAGYGLSGFSKCFMAFATHPWMVLFIRAFDRIGKGVRNSPRDALIADAVDPSMRGKAYGLQSALDHVGEVTGPLIATFLLGVMALNLRVLFGVAAIPGLFAVFLIAWKVREFLPNRVLSQKTLHLKMPHGRLRIYLMILFLFLLSCSTDAFLLLRASELGVPTPLLPILWMVLSVVKALSVMPLGELSDKLGRRKMILMGWIVYTLVYFGFSFASESWHVWALFVCYGFFYGFTEGTERALLVDYASQHEKGQAFGWYYFTVGISALPASLIFGALWQTLGSQAAFLISASISAVSVFLLFIFLKLVPSVRREE